jgi:hypothetical protein
MKFILMGIAAAIAIAVISDFVLNAEQTPAWKAYSSNSSTRVGDPGHNLVGQNWSGDPKTNG